MNKPEKPKTPPKQKVPSKSKPKSQQVEKGSAKKVVSKKKVAKSTEARKVSKKKRTSKKSDADAAKSKAADAIPKHRVLPKKKGFGVAVKFSMFVAALLALIIAGSQTWAYHLAHKRVSDEIDGQGVLLCHTLIGAGQHFLNGLRTKISVDGDDQNKSKSSERKIGELLVEAAKQNHEINEILFNILFTQMNERGEEETLFGEATSMSYFSETEVKGVKRSDTVLENENLLVRRYSLAASDGAYRIYVFLKASRLVNLEQEMKLNAYITAAASLVIGIIGAIALSSRVANPIKILSKDMLKVASGELGHLTHVKGSDELGVLAQSFNLMSKDLEVSHKLALEKLEQDRDLALAHDVQESLLPKRILKVPGYDIKPFYRSAKDVGGDYYDVVQVDQDRVAYVVADVAGKGTQGAMIMAMTRGVARSYLRGVASPALALSRVNRSLAQDLKPGSFVTAMCAILNYKTNELVVASAGHNPMMLVRHNKNTCESINPSGIALGFDKGALFNKTIKDQVIQLRAGDRVVLYTDGVVEAMSPEREEYGEKRFEAFCVTHASQKSEDFVYRLIESLDEHKGSAPQHDDITVVALRKMA